MPDSGLFESTLQVEATAVVIHPPGTTFDANGKPIPPPNPAKDDDK
jgi:hypothetical protein